MLMPFYFMRGWEGSTGKQGDPGERGEPVRIRLLLDVKFIMPHL